MTDQNQQARLKRRIALYGGSFDPIHNAHLAVAGAALKQCNLDYVVFIPAATSPLKKDGPVASDEARQSMLQLALQDEPRFEIDSSELERGGLSYTVDTVSNFRQREPETELSWIIGADQFEQLDRWYAIEDLCRMLVFLVLARPGFNLHAPSISGLNWIRVNAPMMRESSSLVREYRSRGESLHDMVPDAVEAFIQAESLYI